MNARLIHPATPSPTLDASVPSSPPGIDCALEGDFQRHFEAAHDRSNLPLFPPASGSKVPPQPTALTGNEQQKSAVTKSPPGLGWVTESEAPEAALGEESETVSAPERRKAGSRDNDEPTPSSSALPLLDPFPITSPLLLGFLQVIDSHSGQSEIPDNAAPGERSDEMPVAPALFDRPALVERPPSSGPARTAESAGIRALPDTAEPLPTPRATPPTDFTGPSAARPELVEPRISATSQPEQIEPPKYSSERTELATALRETNEKPAESLVDRPVSEKPDVSNNRGLEKAETRIAVTGTSTAKQIVPMKNALEMNEVAELAGKNLPGDAPSFRPPTPGLRDLTERPAKQDAASQSVALQQSAPSSALVENTPSTTRTESSTPVTVADRITQAVLDGVAELRQRGTDSVSVVLKPEGGSELFLRVEMRDGALSAQLHFQQGDSSGMEHHFKELQERLAAQGVRLERAGNFTSPGGDHPRDSHPPAPVPHEAAPRFTSMFSPVNSSEPRTSTRTNRSSGFETWA